MEVDVELMEGSLAGLCWVECQEAVQHHPTLCNELPIPEYQAFINYSLHKTNIKKGRRYILINVKMYYKV